MKSEEHCRDWKLFLIRINPKPGERCHICLDVFKVNSFINWHPDQLCGCHKECRDGLPKPEPTPEVNEKRYDVIDESSDKKWFSEEKDDREFHYGYPIWSDADKSMLEEMWKDGRGMEEIKDALSSVLPFGFERSENAIRLRIRKLGLEEKTGRYLERKTNGGTKSGVKRGDPRRWSDDDKSMLEEMWKDGRSMEEIAIALRRTENAIDAKIRELKIEQKTGRIRPATQKQLDFLDKLGYDGDEPTDIEYAKKIITKMLEEPPSQQLLDELEEARDSFAKKFIPNEEDFETPSHPSPETNLEALTEIAKVTPPTEHMIQRFEKRFGREPNNKFEYHEQMPRNISKDRYHVMKEASDDEDDEDYEDEEHCPECKGMGTIGNSDCIYCHGERTMDAYNYWYIGGNDS